MVTLVGLGIGLSFLYFVFQNKTCFELKHKKRDHLDIGGLVSGLFLLLIILIGMSASRGGDVRSFIAFYNYIAEYSKNPWDYTYELFSKIALVFLKLWTNSTYFEFRAVLILLIWVGVFFFYKEYIYSFKILFFLYLFSGTFMHDGAQIKNYVAVAFLLYGLTFLFNDKLKSLILYYIFVTVAVLFHFSFLVYLLIPLVKTHWFKCVKKGIPILGGGIYAIFFWGGTGLTGTVLRALSYLPMMDKLNTYLTSYSGKRSLVLVFIYYTGLYAIYRCRFGRFLLDEKKAKLLNLIYDSWLLMGIMLPFLIYANAAYRLFRNLYIPSFMVMSNYIVSIPRLSKKRLCVSGIILCFVLLLCIQPILFGQWFDTYQLLIDGYFFWK